MNTSARQVMIACCFIIGGCFSHPEFLESKYLMNRTVAATCAESNLIVTVTGFCGHSALGVGKAQIFVEGDVFRVEFPLCYGAPSTISERFSIPSSVDKVVLAGELVWERKKK